MSDDSLSWVDELDLDAARREVKQHVESELLILNEAQVPSYTVWLMYWREYQKELKELRNLRDTIADRGCDLVPELAYPGGPVAALAVEPCGECPGCLWAKSKKG